MSALTTAGVGSLAESATARPAKAGAAHGRRRRSRVGSVVYATIAVILFVAFVFPVYWMVNTSLQPSSDVLSYTPSFFPKHLTFDAYTTAWTQPNPVAFPHALKNSLFVTLITLVVSLLVAFAGSVAVTRFRFKGRRTFIVAILVVQMIPTEAMFVSVYKILDSWHLTNSIPGLAFVYIAGALPFTIWTLRGFVAAVPADLEEAAMIDGCSRTQAFWKVTFPLLAPGLVATGVFAFIQAWNEFILALTVMTRPDNVTLPVWLRFFQQATKATDWSALMAGSVLMSIPVVVFFLIVQGRMTGGLVSGAVKG